MAKSTDEFFELLAMIRRGDENALATLIREYEPEVRRAAHAVLGPALRPYLDSIDIAQSVNLILIVGLRSQQFEVLSPDKLIALTAQLVRRRVSRHWRRVRRQDRLDSTDEQGPLDLVERLASLQRPADDPAQIVAYRDQVASLLSELNDMDRQLLELRLEGLSTAEAARRLGADPAVLRVRLGRLRRRFRERGLSAD
jgi:RNA polymerase sigma factor (sigma-70 family)